QNRTEESLAHKWNHIHFCEFVTRSTKHSLMTPRRRRRVDPPPGTTSMGASYRRTRVSRERNGVLSVELYTIGFREQHAAPGQSSLSTVQRKPSPAPVVPDHSKLDPTE